MILGGIWMNKKKSATNTHEEYVKNLEKAQYKKFIDNPNLTPKELWELSTDNFHFWCKKNYFPRLVEYFKLQLERFSEWQKIYNITDDELINHGPSKFIAPKRPPKGKKLYILHAKSKNFDGNIISYRNIKKGKNLIGDHVKYDKLKDFIPYHDWCLKNEIQPKILPVKTTYAPNAPTVEIELEGGFKLLKMGGIEKPSTNIWLNDNGKEFEFINLSMLTISGQSFLFGNQQFECTYCIANNLKIKNSKIALPRFNHCEIRDIGVSNSTLQQFQFYNCILNGEILNSNIISFWIYGGMFRPIIKDTFISDIRVKPIRRLKNNQEREYQLFKNIYKNQGEDDSARKYHYLEKIENMKKSKRIKKIAKVTSWLFWGFGYRPLKIAFNSFLLTIVFALTYTFLFPGCFKLEPNNGLLSFFDFWYISLVSFTTLGFGDVNPYGFVRLLVGFESLIGAMCIGFLVASLVKNKY